MNILVAIALNLSILLALSIWLRRQMHMVGLGKLVLPLLALKLVACWLSVRWFLSGDAQYFLEWAGLLTQQLRAAPKAWLHTAVSETFRYRGSSLLFHGFSNTFFFIKILSLLNLASLGNALLNGVYLSLFSFIGFWKLVRVLQQAFSSVAALAGAISFLVWPTTVYWTSGITKESLLVGSGAWLTAIVLGWLYAGKRPRVLTVVGLLVLTALHFKMRFFFAVVLLGALVGVTLNRIVQRMGLGPARGLQLVLFAGLMLLGTWTASEISPVFRFNKFTSQLIRNYSDLLAVSHYRPHIEYDDLAPTWQSIAWNAPKAVFSTLARPLPWEEMRGVYVWAGLENLFLLALVAIALGALPRQRAGVLPFALVLALVFYSFVLAVLLGLSTPNLGTLNRYRVAMLPYLVLLLLQNEYVARWLRRLLPSTSHDIKEPSLGARRLGV
ncbi:hypothetical protein [Hymenobacter jejuensis]|uniref:Glycosyltransferase RgtA/B/C/D-like domain-containing protein n=1 Tax=Hymenobacter jejuensis TaxID=2502781 RepID=A0A5B8A4N2_9BACT|nr:hypothetical protein [Hymenobacter jejuensis]QDA62221.1 hypothetical protein FHG12_19900 [Hymenobacter jejuensis]